MRPERLTLLALAGCLLLVLLSGCGGTPRATARAPKPPPPPLHHGPLTDFVASAGLRWMIVGRPAALADNKAVAEALSPIIPPARLAAYAQGTGVDLTHTKSALVAGFDYSTLYMAETNGDNSVVQRAFETRLLRGAVDKKPHPDLDFVQGVVGRTPETLVRLRGQLVAVAVGDPTPTRVVEAYALKRLKRSPTALDGAALSTLPDKLAEAPIVFYAPGPFKSEWVGGAHGLLGAALAVAITVSPLPGKRVRARVVLSGDWKSEGPDGPSRLLATWDDLAHSSTGKLLGLDDPAAAPVLSTSDKLLSLQVELRLAPLVDGLHAAVAADVQEMLDISSSTKPRGRSAAPPIAPSSTVPKPPVVAPQAQ